MALFIALLVLLVIAGIVIEMAWQNKKLEEEVSWPIICENPQDLLSWGYKPLTNVLRKVQSNMDPRPLAVIKDYSKKGWQLILCEVAVDRSGRNRVPECYSLWGRKRGL